MFSGGAELPFQLSRPVKFRRNCVPTDRLPRCLMSPGAGPQRLPGTNAVLFTAAPRDGGADRFEKGQVVVQSLDDGRRTVVVETGNDGRYLLSGHLVYAVGGVLFAAAFDPRAPTAVTGVRRITFSANLSFWVSRPHATGPRRVIDLGAVAEHALFGRQGNQ